jgi:hypothetical protein
MDRRGCGRRRPACTSRAPRAKGRRAAPRGGGQGPGGQGGCVGLSHLSSDGSVGQNVRPACCGQGCGGQFAPGDEATLLVVLVVAKTLVLRPVA